MAPNPAGFAGGGLGRPPGLSKQASEGTLRLQGLRRQLEELEAQKANWIAQEEMERKLLREEMNKRYHALKESIDERIAQIDAGLERIAGSADAAAVAQVAVPIDDEMLFAGKPTSGRDAALALAFLEQGGSTSSSASSPAPPPKIEGMETLEACAKSLREEKAFLNRERLAAKIMGNVSLQQKKLLNLAHSWLRTYLPHCLAKINRVSYGLLTEEDCEAVLKDDPFVPRSRLKLAVPFVGKDVPSTSSEFAHPDIIIGLTILAYRYSGLRISDFNDIVDALTSEYSREIGPARERPSSKRHEFWVLQSGGRLRGLKLGGNNGNVAAKPNQGKEAEEDDDKEVVQLKFLSKSNAEQMGKLFKLFVKEPHVIHHYLSRFIFPAYMRNQQLKISASGQSVGGDMLFSRRVGFSGTPSDLLPKELGKCSYETGDDGKMLSTVLDKDVSSYEHLPSDWSVENLLKMIATSEAPRFHALIDTGALITGYSNKQVAEELLRLGLPWCDGIVFLDENDKQNVLVRDTGRVVPADQCGVPLERRFAFYDQIHTTGMDIQHVVNATAAITLGKDMVFRDFVQGAYRMRGIGLGQKIRVFIIPEVRNLIDRELKLGGASSGAGPEDKTLVHVVAWLVVNSMRSEMMQWSMLCLQNVTNVFRKNAFKKILKITTLAEGKPDATTSENNPPPGTLADDESAALAVFDEPIDFSVDARVPDPVPFTQKLRDAVDEHSAFVWAKADQAVIDEVFEEVARSAATDGRTMERLDSEQEREQEQEQEKEIRTKREQEIEVEKFVDREYTRTDESQKSWHVSSLLMAPASSLTGGSGALAAATPHPFFPLSEFKLRYQEPLKFPEYLAASRNYFNPSWTGLRRVKNVVMVLEYTPDVAALSLRGPQETFQDSTLSSEPKARDAFAKAYDLLSRCVETGTDPYSDPTSSASSSSQLALTPSQLRLAVRAAADVALTDEELKEFMELYGEDVVVRGAEGEKPRRMATMRGLERMLTSGKIRMVENGRYFVAVSLSEAETLRRVLHMQRDGESLLSRSMGGNKARVNGVECALRYIPLQTAGKPAVSLSAVAGDEGGMVFDASRGWRRGTKPETRVPRFHALSAHSAMRFLDCAQHYSNEALNVLIRGLQKNVTYSRELFFQTTVAARRRLERKWQETPLAKVFTTQDEWMLMKHHSFALFMRQALKSQRLTLWEAFTSFDFDDNGVLSPAEFYGAIRFLGLPSVEPEDVVDLLEAADTNDDGVIDYREYLEMLKRGKTESSSKEGKEEEAEEDDEEEEEKKEEDDNSQKESHGETGKELAREGESSASTPRQAPPKVEPYGAEVLREIIARRRRDKAVRQRQDRIRRQAYQQALDIKVFEAELKASINRKAGPNPDTREKGLTVFRFNNNDAPIRLVASGKWRFQALRQTRGDAAKPFEMTCADGHKLVIDHRWWDYCTLCARRQTKLRCPECPMGYYVCAKCQSRAEEDHRRKAEDITEKATYAQVFGGSSFSLQIPAKTFGVNIPEEEEEGETKIVKLEPLEGTSTPSSSASSALPVPASQSNSTATSTAGPAEAIADEGVVEPVVRQEEIDEASSNALEAKAERFTVTMEIRFDRIPPKHHAASLLRFYPSTFGHSRSRHVASVYLNSKGRVVHASRLGVEDIEDDDGDDEEEEEEEEKETEKPTEGDKAGEGTEAAKETGKKKKKLKPASVTPNQWHVISVVVDAPEGRMTSFIDGKRCETVENLDGDSLTLRHQIVVLGGGKQAQARGGQIHRLSIHDRALSEAEVESFAKSCAALLETRAVWYSPPSTPVDPVITGELTANSVTLSTVSTLPHLVGTLKSVECVKCVIVTALEYDDGSSKPSEGNDEKEPAEGEEGEQETKPKKAKRTTSVPIDVEKTVAIWLGNAIATVNLIRSVAPAAVIVFDATHMTSKLTFKQGEKVMGRWRKQATWYPGRITRVADGDRYDIGYDDGDTESNVTSDCIRSMSSNKISAAQAEFRRLFAAPPANGNSTSPSSASSASATAKDVVVAVSPTELKEAVYECDATYAKRKAKQETV